MGLSTYTYLFFTANTFTLFVLQAMLEEIEQGGKNKIKRTYRVLVYLFYVWLSANFYVAMMPM